METKTTTGPGPKKRHPILKTVLWIFGVLVVLVIAVFFVATSAAFFKGVILPKVSKSLNADVTVSDASIHPFSSVVLKDLKVQSKGYEPLLTAKEVRARYSLFDIMKGHIKVEEAALDTPVIQIVKGPDGKSNLDPIQNASKSKKKQEPSKPSTPSKPPQLDIGKVSLINGTVRQSEHKKDGSHSLTELSGLNVTLENLRNGQTGKLGLGAAIAMEAATTKPATNGAIQAKLDGNFTFALTSDLKPGSIKGNTRLNVVSARGSMADVADLGGIVDCDVDPTMIKQVALKFQKANANLGEVRVSGPFDMAKTEGKLNVEILNIDKQVLNLAGAASGMDFGTTRINSTNQIEIAKGGTVVTVIGELAANKIALTQKGKTTPVIDFGAGYNLTVDQNAKVASVQTFNLTGTQNQKPILKGGLTSPMKLAWGQATPQSGDAALNVQVTQLDLADWKSFAGDLSPNGVVTMTLKLLSQQSGKLLTFNLDSRIERFSAKMGTNAFQPVTISAAANGQASDLKKFDVKDFRFELGERGQSMLTASGNARYDTATQEAESQLNVESQLARLSQFLSQPDMQISGGSLTMKGRVSSRKDGQTVAANLAVNDLSGKLNASEFERFGTTADLDLDLRNQVLKISKANGTLRQSGNAGGAFNVTGNYDLNKKAGQFDLKLDDLNQNTLKSFLASTLKDKKLVTVSVNATASAKLDPQAESSIKADFQLTKLVVQDPKQAKPIGPLEAKLNLDSSLQKQVLNLRQAQITLTPTQRAKNQLQLTGKVDMTKTNAMQGGLKIAADSLDVTPYYDIVSADDGKSSSKAGTAPPPGPAPSGPAKPQQEPAAVNLPFQNFLLELAIGHVYLRDLEITNWQTGVKLDGGHVLLKPLQLVLNGAPINGNVDLNLAVPGYQYDVALNADRVPLAPLANTFSPKFRDSAKGQLLANIQIKGAGITGASLQKALNGKMGFTLTNADIQLPKDFKYRKVLETIGFALNLPDLSQYALQWVNGDVTIADGKINLNQMEVLSEAYMMKTHGIIPIAKELTNSALPNLPLELSLTRNLAVRASLAPANTPTNTAYVALPVFARVGGTIGNVDTKIDKVVITTTIAKAAASKFDLPGKVGGDAGKILQGVIGGGSNTNAAGTTETNKSTAGSVLQGLQGILGGKTNAPADTNKQAPAGGLFDIFKKK